MSDGGAGRCKGCLACESVRGTPWGHAGPIDLLNVTPQLKAGAAAGAKPAAHPDLTVQEHSCAHQ